MFKIGIFLYIQHMAYVMLNTNTHIVIKRTKHCTVCKISDYAKGHQTHISNTTALNQHTHYTS